MNPAAFLQAEQLEPLPRVLGVRLQTFSLGHRWLLRATENAYLSGGPATLDDLTSGVLICGQSFEDARRTILESIENPVAHNRQMAKWHSSLCGESILTKLRLQKRIEVDYEAHSKAFGEHLSTSEAHPDYKYEPGEPIEAPLEQIIKVHLMRAFAISEREIMDRSWKKCVLDFLTIRAIDGGLDFQDGEEIDGIIADVVAWKKRMDESRAN